MTKQAALTLIPEPLHLDQGLAKVICLHCVKLSKQGARVS